MRHYIAPLSVLFLSCLLPITASAETSARALCRNAEANPAAFLKHSDFADRIVKMSTKCPDVALALTNTITGTVPGVTNHSGDKVKKGPKNGHDYSDLLDRLKVATKNLDSATVNVAKAQANLERTIRRANQSGLSEQDLQALYALDEDHGNRRTLPDFTASKREALAKYVAARDRLTAAEAKLDQANENARPLVEKALQLAGKANVAQEDLAKSLNGLTASERQALLDKTLADATASLADLEAQIKSAGIALGQADQALKAALNNRNYVKAVKELKEEQEDFAEAAEDVQKAESRFAEADAKLKAKLAEDAHCKGSACRKAKFDAFDAADDLADAKADLSRQNRDLEEAQKDLAKLEKALDIEGLNAAYKAQAAALAASQAAEMMARDLAEETSRQAKELADLLSATADALANAQSASDEAKAATAEEEAEVAAARAALDEALAAAQAALEGTEESRSALYAVDEAKHVLRAALDALGAAQSVADTLTEEVASIPDAPAEVETAADALEDASQAGEEAADQAEQTYDDAFATMKDSYNADDELSEALPDQPNTSDANTSEADAEASEPNT
jgi:chromosome segregation ATPase